jgi:hypothetical protein
MPKIVFQGHHFNKTLAIDSGVLMPQSSLAVPAALSEKGVASAMGGRPRAPRPAVAGEGEIPQAFQARGTESARP